MRSLPWVHILTDSVIIVVSLYLSLWLRLGNENLYEHLPAFHYFVPIFLVLRLVTFWAFGVYRAMWRYTSIPDAARLGRALVFSALLFLAATYILFKIGFVPRSA